MSEPIIATSNSPWKPWLMSILHHKRLRRTEFSNLKQKRILCISTSRSAISSASGIFYYEPKSISDINNSAFRLWCIFWLLQVIFATASSSRDLRSLQPKTRLIVRQDKNDQLRYEINSHRQPRLRRWADMARGERILLLFTGTSSRQPDIKTFFSQPQAVNPADQTHFLCCRIHWLHLCKWVRLHPTSVLQMTLNKLTVRF